MADSLDSRLSLRIQAYIEKCDLKDLAELGSYCFGLQDPDVKELQAEIIDKELAIREKTFEAWHAEYSE